MSDGTHILIVEDSPFQVKILKGMDLDELLNMEVTSISKKAESLQDAASSIYVITEEDIRRSGATRIQDVFNLVPGFWMIDLNYDVSAASIREVPESYAQSVNILMDGVPITNPIFGMVYEGLQLPLTEIKRIEVIKGPGGTVYGANSATGIINIITKDAKDSKGLFAYVDAGTRGYISPTVRGGLELGEGLFLSAYGSYEMHSGWENPYFEGDKVKVPWYNNQSNSWDTRETTNKFNSADVDNRKGVFAGTKLFYQGNDRFSVKADIYGRYNWGYDYAAYTNFDNGLTSFWDAKISNNNLTANIRFDYTFNEKHSLFFRPYYSWNPSLGCNSGLGGSYNTSYSYTEGELQYNGKFFSEHFTKVELIAGSNARGVNYDIGDYRDEQGQELIHSKFRFVDPENWELLYAGFIQDKISFGDYVDLITGIKGETWTLISDEHEYSPSARLVVKPHKKLTAWGAWSRSITTPGYLQSNVELGVMLMNDTLLSVTALDGLKPTYYYTSEGGVRTSFIPGLFVDLSGYYTIFKGKIGGSADQIGSPIKSRVSGEYIRPRYYTNLFDGKLYGAEALVKSGHIWKVARLEVSYAWFQAETRGLLVPPEDTSYAIVPEVDKVSWPEHVVKGRLYLDLPSDVFITVNGQLSSKFRFSNDYDYYNQQAMPSTSHTVFKDINAALFKINFKIEKLFLDKRLNVFVWGNNVFHNDPYLEGFDMSIVSHPYFVHSRYGLGASFLF
ncbi:MAG: TonB-dependent receptor plug domain-containing protein [Fibrobacteria bacterium]|nr:TonB-dependent receptor plug domain-containing protein [Fibrobacteria bacterium]